MAQRNYPSFMWQKKWAAHIRSLRTPKEQIALFDAITDYGLYGETSDNLSGAGLECFNKHIKPELDIQHQRWERRLAQ